jgi:hypothetical protein
MINNLDKIKSILSFPDEDTFYHLQILKRKKEHPELGSNSYVVKTYYISSLEYLDGKMPEIISLCKFHNARGCINLNRRSFEKTAYHLLKKVTDQIMNRDFKSVRKAYESVCGMHSDESDKKWIVDIDHKDDDKVAVYINDIRNCEPGRRMDKVYRVLETKNGYHLITKPFNKEEFKQLHPDVDIHTNNPTILIIP